jgi:CRP/FNR family transcriptional regulator, cyclic AMP receptor protein
VIERFQGESNYNRLIEAIKRQVIVRDDEALASRICAELELLEFDAGAQVITQGNPDDDLYFVFSGRVSVMVNGRELAVRSVGEHVGEMALIDPSAYRSASVVALEKTVVGKISEPVFSRIAESFPRLWRLLALYLGDRLRQRNEDVLLRNPRPVIFIGSATESLSVAREIQSGLRHDDYVVRLWTDGVFGASSFPIDILQQQVRSSDFGVMVLGPEDKTISRGVELSAPRDNTIFELGLLMGALERHRTFLVSPRGIDIRIPSDLLGLTPLQYRVDASDLPSSIAPVCNDLRTIVNRLGPK